MLTYSRRLGPKSQTPPKSHGLQRGWLFKSSYSASVKLPRQIRVRKHLLPRAVGCGTLPCTAIDGLDAGLPDATRNEFRQFVPDRAVGAVVVYVTNAGRAAEVHV